MSHGSTQFRFRPGPLLLRFYHTPAGRLRDCLKQGGPWQQRRTERGRQEMECAAHALPPPAPNGSALELHLLTGKRFWYQSAFCLHSFATHAQRMLHPRFYDDGSLREADRDALGSLFPHARFISLAETTARLEQFLPRTKYPVLRERWDNYPNIRKLIDPHLGSQNWKLVLDSDLLFFRPPAFLIAWLESPARPLHAIDAEQSYGYTDALLRRVALGPLADRLNVGLCGLNSSELDWDHLEYVCRILIESEGNHYYLEQALVAILLAGRSCSIAPEGDYLTLPRPPEAQRCDAVMHHYVAESKRWYFQHNWRRCVAPNNG